MSQRFAGVLALLLMTLFASVIQPATAFGQDVGVVKVSKGTTAIERGGQQLTVPVGTKVREGDVVTTGADGSVGITFGDNSLLSIGPDSRLSIDRYAFDSTTHKGQFETSLNRGTLAAVSGKIAKQSPDAMKVRTPAALLGVRGTEFVVRTGEPAGTAPGR